MSPAVGPIAGVTTWLFLALYGILLPDEDEILYLGKADGSTVRSRWNADDKHERVRATSPSAH
jgi:hypothetical protein